MPLFTPPGFLVPITAQSLGVMLAGAILGARRGFLSLLLLLVLVAVGLPLLAGSAGRARRVRRPLASASWSATPSRRTSWAG